MNLKELLQNIIPGTQYLEVYERPFEDEPIKARNNKIISLLKPEVLNRNVSKIQSPYQPIQIFLEEETNETNEREDGMKFDFFEKLKGARLVSVDEDEHKITVSKNDKCYVIAFDEDDGECCGFNEIVTELYVGLESNSPVITNVTVDTDGSEELENGDYTQGEYVRIVFFGESKKLMSVKSLSSSGSGWCYGACVTARCKALDIEEVITKW